MKTARIVSPGMGISFQDAGRSGWARFGVPPGGAMDIQSMKTANHLVGNPWHFPVLEILMQGVELEFLKPVWVAVTGGEAGASIPSGAARPLAAGTRLRFHRIKSGLWIYVAVEGGWSADRFLKSSSTHIRAGLGTRLVARSILHSNSSGSRPFPSSIATRKALPQKKESKNPLRLHAYPGAQYSKFPSSVRNKFERSIWTVSPDSDRTGYRLQGPLLKGGPEIVSEPLTPGTVQIPGNGQPIVTMPDGPTVGGYPKLAWIPPEDRWELAQSPPGSQISFQWIFPSSMPTSEKEKPSKSRGN